MTKIIRFSDGLANRMFQYSCYIYLKQKGYDVAIDDSTPHYLEHDLLEWKKIFPKAEYTQAKKFKCLLYGGGFDVFSKLLRHYFAVLTKCRIMNGPFDIPTDEMLGKANYFIGVMQNYRMVEEIKNEILKKFIFTPFDDNSKNKKLADILQSQESVSIHIRKGNDYLSRDVYKNTCPIDYYLAAVDYIKSKISNPHFYVFTDNIQWVRNELKGFDYIIIEGNPTVGWGNHFDMQLMSMCKHNIIANSTYSWWGAFLNNNPLKEVVCPKLWFNPDLEKYCRLNKIMQCAEWTVL